MSTSAALAGCRYTKRWALTLGFTDRFGVKAEEPLGTSTQPPSLHTATRPPMTPTRRPSATSAVYSVPRMPMVPEGVSSL